MKLYIGYPNTLIPNFSVMFKKEKRLQNKLKVFIKFPPQDECKIKLKAKMEVRKMLKLYSRFK